MLIKQTGANIAPTRFSRCLRDDGYLMYRNGDNVLTQKSLEVGLAKTKEMILCLRGRIVLARLTALATGKGQRYFVQKYGKQKTVLAVNNG